MRRFLLVPNIALISLILVHAGYSPSWWDGYRWGDITSSVHGCSLAAMKSLRESSDNVQQWLHGCQKGLEVANISVMVPGTSTSSSCTNVQYSQPSAGTGKLKAVTLQIT